MGRRPSLRRVCSHPRPRHAQRRNPPASRGSGHLRRPDLYVAEQLQRVGRQLVRREVKTGTSEAPRPLPDLCSPALKFRKRRQDTDREHPGVTGPKQDSSSPGTGRPSSRVTSHARYTLRAQEVRPVARPGPRWERGSRQRRGGRLASSLLLLHFAAAPRSKRPGPTGDRVSELELEPRNRIELLTFSLPWRRSAD
jgi:hypothetical protein